jgi:hypothetical protein
MTTITLESPLTKIKKTNFRNEKELIMYFMEITNYDYIDFQELSKEELDSDLINLVNESKKNNICDLDNI